MGFFKKDGRGRPDFHELHLLFQLFLEFQEISRPSTKAFQHVGRSLQTHGMLGKVTCKGAPVAHRHWQASAPVESG